MNRRNFLITAAAAGSAAALPGTVRAGTAGRRPNIVFILCDQWRKHALGFMNQDKVLTPNLDALAVRSALFTNAISTVPVCGPNRACLFTGKYSMRTGLLANDCRLLPEHQTFGELSKAAGYQTAYLGKWHLGDNAKTAAGINRGYVEPEFRHGFDFWYKSEGHQPFCQPWFVGDERTRSFPGGDWEPDHLEKTASAFVTGRDKSRPFAMTLSFAPPHTGGGRGFEDRSVPGRDNLPAGYGYAAPEKYEQPYIEGGACHVRPVRKNVEPLPDYEKSKCVQGYFGAVTAIDEALGRFFKTLENEGVLDDTIIIITADHGELMGSHGRMTKGLWYQESIGIPMIVHYPAAVKPARYSCVFNSIDVLPTLLGLSGLPGPGNLDGTDFSALLRGEPQKTPEYAFGAYYRGGAPGYETNKGWRHFRAVYTERFTYLLAHGNYASVAGAKELLYDLQTDPYEMKPVKRGEGQDELMDHFKTVLAGHLESVKDPFIADVWPKDEKDVDWTPYRNLTAKTYF
jgi:arylsulfatase A-like enzyme